MSSKPAPRRYVFAGMLAEQLGDLQSAEGHYEQHLALANTQHVPDMHAPEWAAAYANVMKVSSLQLLTAVMNQLCAVIPAIASCQQLFYSACSLQSPQAAWVTGVPGAG